MTTQYIPSDRNAAAYAASPASFIMIKTAIAVVSTAGTIDVFGPNNPNNTATVAADLSSSPTQRRAGHRLCIWAITGGDNDSGAGTRTAVIFTFKTATVAPDGTTVTIGGIIARGNRVVDISTSGGWGLHRSEMITPFAPIPNMPLVIGDPDCGITIVTAATGSDGDVPIEILASFVPTKIPSVK